MTDLKECKIIGTIDIQRPSKVIQTPCGKFLIGIEGHSIFRYCLETKQKFRIAGSVEQSGHQDGTRDESRFNYPKGLTLSKYLKNLFVADTYNRVIRAICVGTGVTTTFAGQVRNHVGVDGPKEKACFKHPTNLKLSPDTNALIVTGSKKLRSICITTGQVDTVFECLKMVIHDFTFSPDGKHVFIRHWSRVSKYNLETWKSELILKIKGFFKCILSKNGQVLFVAGDMNRIQVVNLVTNKVIDTINIPFRFTRLSISTNGKQLHIVDYHNDKIQVLDISKYCTNFKTFLQLQLSKYSFLPRQVVNSFSI
jgi:DNA-binding beta-propeller fold protein YncE